MNRRCILTFALLLLTRLAIADEKGTDIASSSAEPPDLEVVLVTGEQPGPALWKVTSGDHVLWILGEVAPQPNKVTWRSKKFERLLANSQEVLLDFSGGTQSDRKDGVAEARARKLPHGQTLKDVISPELHARAEAARKLYRIPENIEELRPFYAGHRILMSALRSLEMEKKFSASFAVQKLARKAGVKITYLSTPGPTHEDFIRNIEHGSSVPCLELAVEIVGDSGVGLRRLANAWSVGDIQELRRLVPLYAMENGHKEDKCAVAVYGGEPQANEYTLKRTDYWLSGAERALRENQSTMAVVRIGELFATDGYLASLRSRRYEVVEPD